VRAYLEVQEQFDEILVWKASHLGREGCGGRWKKFNLIIATLFPPTILLDASGRYVDVLVERKSVWTETSGLPGPRNLGTPVLPVAYINPPVRLPSPPTTLQPLLPSTQVDLAYPLSTFQTFNRFDSLPSSSIMRVLITNSLVLAAISLAPSASAAPYSATSSVDSYDSYPNSTTVAQDPGSSSVPSMLYPYGRTITLSRPTSPLDVRRDEVIHIESLYDGSPFGNVFGPVADLFNSMGMTTISDSTPLTDAQKLVLGQLGNAVNGATSSVIANLHLPVSPRDLEDRQIPDPLAVFRNLPLAGGILAPIMDLLSSAGLGPNSATSLTDTQKQVIDQLQTVILTGVGKVAANLPVGLDVLPLSHQSRSVEERSLEDVISIASNAPFLGQILAPAIALMKSTGVTNGTPLNDAQKLFLSKLQEAIAEATKSVEHSVPSVHTEHAREEPEHWTQDHYNDPHMDDHHSHDDRKDNHGSQDARKDDRWSQDAREDGHKSPDVREDGRGSPDVRKEDHDAQRTDRGGNRCREPRDGQSDERDRWDDWRHRGDGRDRDEESLLRVSLGHSCRP